MPRAKVVSPLQASFEGPTSTLHEKLVERALHGIVLPEALTTSSFGGHDAAQYQYVTRTEPEKYSAQASQGSASLAKHTFLYSLPKL